MLLATALATGLGATAARADDISAEGAQHLEQQLRDWLAAQLGPHAPLPERPFQVTADSDHYRLEIPVAGAYGDTGFEIEGDPLSASIKPLDGGRWAVDDLRIPSPLRVTYPQPGAGKTDDPPTGKVTLTIASQDQHGVLDPSLATPSHLDATLKGYKTTTERGADAGTQTTTIDEVIAHTTWDPAPDGRVNLSFESDSHLFASNAMMPNVGLVSFSAERLHATAHLTGVAPDRVAPLLYAVMDLAPLGMAAAEAAGGPDKKALKTLAEENRKAAEADRQAAEADKQAVAAGRMTPAERKKNTEARIARAKERRAAMLAARSAAKTGPAPELTPEQHAEVHDALVALADLIGGFDEQGTLEDLHIVAAEHTGKLAKLSLGFSAGAPEGKVALKFHLGLDGLDSPDIPPGVFRTYMPRHIALSPRLGGVPATDLRDLLLRAADSNGDDPQLEAQAKALLDKGPVVVGLDELALDFGPATLQGTGEVRVLGENNYEGEAHVTATGLDDLIKLANTEPDLAQAAPVLFLVKGMGKQDGPNTVWDITYRDNKVLVNGNDLSQMMPGGNK